MKEQADETVDDATRLDRLAHVVSTFCDVPPGAYMIAYATDDGGTNGVSYGDIAALVRIDAARRRQLERIAAWHHRERAGQWCAECRRAWPCATRLAADDTWVRENGT